MTMTMTTMTMTMTMTMAMTTMMMTMTNIMIITMTTTMTMTILKGMTMTMTMTMMTMTIITIMTMTTMMLIRTSASHCGSNPSSLGHARRSVEAANVVAGLARVDELYAEVIQSPSTVTTVPSRRTSVTGFLYVRRLTALR